MESQEPISIFEPRYGGSFVSGAGELVPLVLPGEMVVLEPGRMEVLKRSPARVEPGCVHFGVCGGCQYQHAGYPEQLKLKGEILRGIFASEGLVELPAAGIHRGPEWEYRNRIRMRVERDAAGVFRAGYSRRGTNEFLPVRMCPIGAPLLWRAVEALLTAGEQALEAIAEVEMFCTADESRVQMQLFLREAGVFRQGGVLAGICARMGKAVTELVGAGAELDPELNRRVRRRWEGEAWGAPGLSYEVAGRSYWVSRGAFFQVNRFLVMDLVEMVCAGEQGALAWDLFAGVGLFTRALAEGFKRVVAVEAGEDAARDLAIAGRGGKAGPGFEAVHAPVLEFLRARVLERERPELVVLDPPRAGLGVEAAAVLARLNAARVVYVSCDPVTLARDLRVLTETAYRVESVDLVDLFPQTFHMETVVKLRRR